MRAASRALAALTAVFLASPGYSQTTVFTARTVAPVTVDEVTVELNAAGDVGLGDVGTPTYTLSVPSIPGVVRGNVTGQPSCASEAVPPVFRLLATTTTTSGAGLVQTETKTVANSCRVTLSRAANAEPLPRTLTFTAPTCDGANCTAVIAAPSPPVTLVNYNFGGNVTGDAALAGLPNAVQLQSGTTYHVGLIATNANNIGVKGPYKLTFKSTGRPAGADAIEVGGRSCDPNVDCVCAVPSITDRCQIKLPSTNGSYSFTVQSNFVGETVSSFELRRSTATPDPVIINRVGAQTREILAPTAGASPGLANVAELSASVTNAPANAKLKLTSSEDARGELSCGHADTLADYKREVDCDVVDGQVKFRARVKAAGNWSVGASLANATPVPQLYNITQPGGGSNSAIVLAENFNLTGTFSAGSSRPLRFAISPALASVPNCDFTFTAEGTGEAVWEKPAGTTITNPQPCDAEVILRATKPGSVGLEVKVVAGTQATVAPFGQTISVSAAPALTVTVTGNVAAGAAAVTGSVTTTNLPAATPVALSVQPTLVGGPSVATTSCTAAACNFQLSPGTVVGTFKVVASASGAPDGDAPVVIERPSTGGLSFVPQAGIVSLPANVRSTLSVELGTALSNNATALTVTLTKIPENAPLDVGPCTVPPGQQRCQFAVTPQQIGSFGLRASAQNVVGSALLQLEAVPEAAAPRLTGFNPASLRLAPATPGSPPLPSSLTVSFANLPAPPATVPPVSFEITGGPVETRPTLSAFSCTPTSSPTPSEPARSTCTLSITAGTGLGSYELRMLPNPAVVDLQQRSLSLIVSNTESVGRAAASDAIGSTLERAAGGDPVAAAAARPMADVCTSRSAGQDGSEPLRVTCRALIERAETAGTADTSAAAAAAAADVRTALRALNGEEVKGLSDASIAIQRQRQGLVTNRLQELRRGGGRGFSADALSIQQGAHSISVGQALALGKSLAGMNDTGSTSGVTVESLEGWGGFISGNWSREDRDDLGIDRGYEVDGYNLLAGLDREVVPGLVLGFAFGAARTDLEYGGAGGVVDTDSRSVTA